MGVARNSFTFPSGPLFNVEGMSMVIPIFAAVGSAAVFGLSTSLEHREAGQAPSGSIALVRHLIRQPLWLLGLATSVVALGLYALAIGTGSLGLVQPILISGIVFALPIRAAMEHSVPSRQQLGSAAVTTAGLAMFLLIVSPTSATNAPQGHAALLFITAGVPVAAVLARRGLRDSGHRSGVLLGCAAGIVLGLMAGALKMTVVGIDDPIALLRHWPLWVFIALAGWGTLLNQHAYREAPLAVSMPIVNILGPLIGIAFAGLVFGEIPHHSPLQIALELLGLGAIAYGLRGLAETEIIPVTETEGASESVGAR